LFRFNFIQIYFYSDLIFFEYKFYSNSKFIQNLKLFKSKKKEKKKQIKKLLLDRPNKNPLAGGASLARANVRRLGAPLKPVDWQLVSDSEQREDREAQEHLGAERRDT
jgi:hypothetical protein